MTRRVWVIVPLLTIGILALSLRLYRFELPHTSALDALQSGSLPPGLYWDEAFNTLAALRLMREGNFEPFIRIDLGRLPLHIYFTTLIFKGFGPITVGGRIAALIPGLLTIVLSGLLVREVFYATVTPLAQFTLAWFAAGQVAVTYWFVHFSRIGMEHSTMAGYSTLAMWGVWWAWRQPSRGRALVAGGLLGLAIYTYPAAYVLPLAVMGVGLHWVITEPPRRSVLLRWGIAYGLAFALTLLPLALFLVSYPEWMLNRPQGVQATSALTIGKNAWATVGGLFWRGDFNTSLNLRDRPVLDVLQAMLFLIGLGVCGRRFRQTPYAFSLIWLGVMLLPQVLSEAPHFGRIAGATVPATLIVALGGLTIWQTLARRSTVLATLTLVGLTLISATLTAHDYFIRWPQTSDFYPTFRVAERLEAELALAAPPNTIQYLTPVNGEVPTIRYLLGDHPEAYLKSFNGRQCTILPPLGQPARYLITPYEDQRTVEQLKLFYPTPLVQQVYRVEEAPFVVMIDVPAQATRAVPEGHWNVAGQQFGQVFIPLAVRLPAPTISASLTELPITLIGEVLGQTAETLTLGFYLLGPNFPEAESQLVTQQDAPPCGGAYPTSQWTPGEWLIEERSLPLPPNLPPGKYTLALALYRFPDLERLPVTDASGAVLGDLASLADIVIERP